MEQRHLPHTGGWQRELVLGLRLMREGDFSGAERQFELAHRSAPSRPEVCFALGRERLRRGRVAEAEELLAAAWRGDPSLASAAAALARCLAIHQGRFAEAHDLLDEAVTRHPGEALFDVVRAEILLEEGRTDEAKLRADAALAGAEADSTTAAAARAALARVHNRDGLTLARSGEHERALFAFKRAADCDPHWSSPHVNIGATFLALGRRAPARAALRTALEIDPDNPLAHLDLGLLLSDDDSAASEHLRRALELDPELDEARVALAEHELRSGDPDLACALLSDRLERHPGDPGAWTDLGSALVTVGDREGAESCFRQALEIDAGHQQACHRLADLLAREGRYLEAAVVAQRARPSE